MAVFLEEFEGRGRQMYAKLEPHAIFQASFGNTRSRQTFPHYPIGASPGTANLDKSRVNVPIPLKILRFVDISVARESEAFIILHAGYQAVTGYAVKVQGVPGP